MTHLMPTVFISIGSNINKKQNISGAVKALEARFGPLMLSRVYESEAVGFDGENFYNLVAAFDTDTSLEELDTVLTGIEDRHGRRRAGERFTSRTLDLDLLLYGDLVRHDDGFEIPRKEILEFAFVLQPLAEIAPHRKHPETGISYAEMWRRFDKSGQKLWRVALSNSLTENR